MSLDGGREVSTADMGLTTQARGQKRNGAIRSDLDPAVKTVSGGRRSSAFARVELEHYVEEPWVSRRLLELLAQRSLAMFDTVYDPAAGFGHIPQSARRLGLEGRGSDIVQRAPDIRGGVDFLTHDFSATPFDRRLLIACNPPFSLLAEFAARALDVAAPGGAVALLAPTRRINTASGWLRAMPLQRLLFCTPRPSLLPGEIYRQRVADGTPLGSGREEVCWLIFEKGASYEGRADWLHREGGTA